MPHPFDEFVDSPYFTNIVVELGGQGALDILIDTKNRWPNDYGKIICYWLKGIMPEFDLASLLTDPKSLPDVEIPDLYTDPAEKLQQNIKNIAQRYDLLNSKKCIAENITIGFFAGLLYGIDFNTRKISMTPTMSAHVFQSIMAMEQFALMGILDSIPDIGLNILNYTKSFRRLAQTPEIKNKLEKEKFEQTDITSIISQIEGLFNKPE